MKIISISDIITNSSSEVFCIFSEDTFKRIKELVESILQSFGIDKKFDDLFELVPEYDEYVLEDNPNLTLEDALDHDNSGYEEYPYIIGYNIYSKDKKYNKLAQKLSGLNQIFDYEEVYC